MWTELAGRIVPQRDVRTGWMDVGQKKPQVFSLWTRHGVLKWHAG